MFNIDCSRIFNSWIAHFNGCRIYVKDVVSLGMVMEDGAELGSRKYRVVREDQTYSGDVSVAVTFKV